ncbi:MAG: cytochrome c oxidase subunit 3 [Rudaea sp.]|uniref:cytochrome c oxidase subunit 3 n=1 Tax=Rudaea sp. TaxID=2136325 RepID=UPI0039E58E6A
MTTATPDSVPRRPAHVPGEAGVWLFIAGDLTLFSVLFVTFLHYRGAEHEVFAAGRARLDQTLGLLNTLLMLTSSWCVANAVRAARLRIADAPQRLFRIAIACGAVFGVVKGFEYTAKISAGITPETNDFFMLYFVYTGIHMLHVLIGMGVLAAMSGYVRSRGIEAVNVQHLESGATFWHLVDLLWIVLFALLYLV